MKSRALLLCLLLGVSSVLCTPAGYGPVGVGGSYSGRLTSGGFNGAAGQQYHNRFNDGSYDFGYNTGTGAFQSERKTSSGLVAGKYGHTNPDGTYVNVEYQGQSTGGAGGGASFGRYSSEKAGGGAFSYGSSYSAGGSGLVGGAAPLIQTSPVVAPAAPSYVSPAAPSYVSPVAPQRYTGGRPQEYAQFNLERKPDGSYQYSYQSSDSSKTETRTGDGQVQGSYSFRGDDGVQRTVGYSAGQQGFLADGAHLPVTSDGEPAAGTNQGAAGAAAAYSSAFQSQRYSSGGGYKGQTLSSYQAPVAPVSLVRPQVYSGVGAAYNAGGNYKGSYSSSYTEPVDESPKPFAFNYNAGEHSRQEQADGSGVVKGSYTVNTADGTYKQITYQADDSGFHVIDEKQVEGGGGSSGSAAYNAGAYNAGAYNAGIGAQAAAYRAPAAAYRAPAAFQQQTYKQKSIQSPSYYR